MWYSTKTIGANKKGIKTSCDTLSVITNPDSVRMKWFSSSSYWGYTWGTSNIYDYAKAIYYYLHDSAANVAGAFFHLLVKDVGYGDTIKFYVGQGSMGEPSTLWQSLLVKPIQFIMSLTKDSVIIPVSDIGTNLDTILYIDFPNDPLIYDSLFLMFTVTWHDTVAVYSQDSVEINALDRHSLDISTYADTTATEVYIANTSNYNEDCDAFDISAVICNLTVENEPINQDEIVVYPTVTSDRILFAGIENAEIEIYSITGQKLKVFSHVYRQIHIKDLPNGIYIMKIRDKKHSVTKKIIKK